jgi:hypothetical protein
MDILWSCLFAIIACTWTVLHLNVPEQREGRNPGLLGDIRWMLKRTWTSTKWMLATIIAPEILLGKYWADIEDAQDDLTKLREYIDSDECGWTLSHCLFANMGGFVIREHAPKRYQGHGDKSSQPTDQNQGGTETTSNLAVDRSPSHSSDFPNHANSSEIPPEQKIELESSQALTPSPPYHLIGPGILALRKEGFLVRLPYITEEELQDKSKSDTFVRRSQ